MLAMVSSDIQANIINSKSVRLGGLSIHQFYHRLLLLPNERGPSIPYILQSSLDDPRKLMGACVGIGGIESVLI
jgi:hypothetical protein